MVEQLLREVVSMCRHINEAVLADIAKKMDALAAEISVKDISYEKQIQILRKIQKEFEELLALPCAEAKKQGSKNGNTQKIELERITILKQKYVKKYIDMIKTWC